MKSRRAVSGSKATTLTAVAFQDHLTRNLNLSLADPFKPLRSKNPSRSDKKKLNGIKSVVDSGRRNKTKKKEKLQETEAEFVLDEAPKPLTLAQKLGLIDAPDQHLTDEEWQNVKERSNIRKDSQQPCVICKEDFGLHQQVLLSCSHVFHRNCLAAFERFSGKKTCPMCRKEAYQTRVIYEGAREHKTQCATRIQAAWRGYVVRSWYQKLRQTVPPKDPLLRKKFYQDKLCSITDRMLQSYDTRVDDFLSEIDQSVAKSRDIIRRLNSSKLRRISDSEWEVIQLKAVHRGHTECPICIMPLGESLSEDSPREVPLPESNRPVRFTTLLSCSHVFHRTCIEAFEELSVLDAKVCPVCRSHYQKRTL